MRWDYLLLAFGGLLVLTAVPAAINPSDITGLGDRLWLWCFLAAAGFALLGVACVWLAIAGRGVRRVLAGFGAGCALLASLPSLALGGLDVGLTDFSGEQRVAALSPDGRFAVVLYYFEPPSGHMVDRPSGLYLQTTDGFFSRRGHLGCLMGSDGDERLDSVRFAGANTVVVRKKDGREHGIRFDPIRLHVPYENRIGGDSDDCPSDLYTS